MPELPEYAADGKTHREALRNVETVTEEWLEAAREFAWPIPSQKGARFSHSRANPFVTLLQVNSIFQ